MSKVEFIWDGINNLIIIRNATDSEIARIRQAGWVITKADGWNFVLRIPKESSWRVVKNIHETLGIGTPQTMLAWRLDQATGGM